MKLFLVLVNDNNPALYYSGVKRAPALLVYPCASAPLVCDKPGYYATIASGNPSWLHIQRAARAAKVSYLKLHAQILLKRWPTLVAIPDCVEVHIVLVVGKEEKAEPGVKGVDGYDEKNAHYVPLLLGRAVVT